MDRWLQSGTPMEATLTEKAPTRVIKPRSLAPKEHGAYGQLFMPMGVALLASRPGLVSVSLAVAISAVFFAHEPLVLLLGQRGVRARKEAGARAIGRLQLLTFATVVSGVIVMWQAGVSVFIASAGCVALGSVVGWLAYRKLEKTVAGELFTASALAATAVPIGLAGGLSPSVALGHWAVWSVTFATATLGVHAVIARTRRKPWRMFEYSALAVSVLSVVVFAFVAVPLNGAVGLAIALTPAVLLAGAMMYLRPHARKLRAIGWSTMTVCCLTSLVLVLGA